MRKGDSKKASSTLGDIEIIHNCWKAAEKTPPGETYSMLPGSR